MGLSFQMVVSNRNHIQIIGTNTALERSRRVGFGGKVGVHVWVSAATKDQKRQQCELDFDACGREMCMTKRFTTGENGLAWLKRGLDQA